MLVIRPDKYSSEFFKDCSYSNGYLVIDGLNLVYVLYNKSPRKNCSYGGEYQAFHDHITQFFSVLRKVYEATRFFDQFKIDTFFGDPWEYV